MENVNEDFFLPEDIQTEIEKKVKELKLDVKSFPADMEIINQPVSFYQQYTYQNRLF